MMMMMVMSRHIVSLSAPCHHTESLEYVSLIHRLLQYVTSSDAKSHRKPGKMVSLTFDTSKSSSQQWVPGR